MKLGVVIPYRGVDSILNDLLHSVSELTDKICFVFVNDHSPDSAEYIIRDLLGSHVSYLNNRGRGVADARNTGLDFLKTDWVTFIDSDDQITEGYSELLFSALSKEPHFDLLRFPFSRGDELFDSTKEDIYSVCAGIGYSVAWNKIYRRSFLNDQSLRFPAGGGPFEDVTFLVDLYSRKPRILDIDASPTYIWSVRNTSLTNSSSLCHLEQACEQLTNCLRVVARLDNGILDTFLIMRFFRIFYFKLRELRRDGPVTEAQALVEGILRTYKDASDGGADRYLSLFSYPTFNEVLAEFRRNHQRNATSYTGVFETHDDARQFSRALNEIKGQLLGSLDKVERVAIYGYGVFGKLVHSWIRPKTVKIYDKNAEAGVDGNIEALLDVDSNEFQVLIVAILGQASVLDEVSLKRPDIASKMLFIG
jgi:glycosyltransferase involved in cell wall biosynthesis